MAVLPGAWRYRVSAGTGWPGISILWLGEVDSLNCNFYLSVAVCKIVGADPSLRYTRMCLDIKQPTKNNNRRPPKRLLMKQRLNYLKHQSHHLTCQSPSPPPPSLPPSTCTTLSWQEHLVDYYLSEGRLYVVVTVCFSWQQESVVNHQA